jgi:hypothetical protein
VAEGGPVPRASERRYASALLALLVFHVWLGVAYAAKTPLWQNPDEPAHFNYAREVAQSGGLPELKPGDWDSALLERLKTAQLQPGDTIDAIRYEAWQPPLYYLIAAQAMRFAPQDLATEVRVLRTLDVLLGAATLVLGYAIGRQLFPDNRWLALAVPLAMAGVPMFSSVSASVSADPLANLLAGAVLWTVLRGLTRTSGVLLGLGLLTKLALGVFVPLALLGLARRLQDVAALLLVPLVLLTPWLVHQVATYGWLDPFALSRHADVVQDQPRFPGLSPVYAGAFAVTTFHSFWAQFGWMAIPAPDRLYWTWGAICLLAVAGLLRLGLRGQPASPRWLLVGATILLAAVAYVVYNLAFLQFQGRYLFIALAPICALLVRGWSALLPRRLAAPGALSVGLMLALLNVYTLGRVLEPGFGG